MNALYAVGFHDEKFYGRAKQRKVFMCWKTKSIFHYFHHSDLKWSRVAMAIHHNVDGTALNYALDFSGGTATTVTFNEDMDIKAD